MFPKRGLEDRKRDDVLAAVRAGEWWRMVEFADGKKGEIARAIGKLAQERCVVIDFGDRDRATKFQFRAMEYIRRYEIPAWATARDGVCYVIRKYHGSGNNVGAGE